MPSGAKKRKAAKKKKENQGSSTSNPSLASSTTSSHGEDDLKHQESDGGEVSSPGSQDQDQNQRHHFTDGEEEEVEKQKNTTHVPSAEGVRDEGKEEKKMEEEEGVVQIERGLKSEDESNYTVEHVQPPRKSYDGGASVSSSGSSSSEDESRGLNNIKVVVSNAPAIDSTKSAAEVAMNSVVETFSQVVPEKVPLFGESTQKNLSASADNYSNLIESESKENGAGDSSELKNNEPIIESVAATSDVKDLTVQESDEKLTLSYDAPKVDADNNGEHVKNSEVPESSDSQPLVAPGPHPVQTTSWKSCCGLFEVFTGSSR